VCIEAVTRRPARVLRLPPELGELRAESTAWELGASRAVAGDRKLARAVRQPEEAYDEELLRRGEGDEG
jgi:hypothetical protein